MKKAGRVLARVGIGVVVLAILVLVIVAAAFTGGMKEMVDKIKASLHMYTASSEEEAKGMCDVWCSQELYKTWCDYEFKIGDAEKGCSELGSSCPDSGC